MLARLALVSLVTLSACADDSAIVGPFTGETHRFVIDQITMPESVTSSRGLGKDLDGTEIVDDQLGPSIGSLSSYGDGQKHGAEMIAAGSIASSIEIQADDLQNDDSVGVTFYGRDGAPARVVGGRLVDGRFHPNQIRDVDSRYTGKAQLVLPVFADVDPIELEAVTLEIELDPSANGYEVRLYGAVRPAEVLEKARTAIEAQLLSHPEDHRSMWTVVDLDRDGSFPLEELTRGLLGSLLSHDIELEIDGTPEKVMSFAFRMHATPCVAGACLQTSTASTCFDRVRNGDETDVDCGGTCAIACAGGRACSASGDCQSQSCTEGTCAAVSCTDGVKNGLEASLDCGGACSTKCARGEVCGYAFDCASNACSATTSTGTCR